MGSSAQLSKRWFWQWQDTMASVKETGTFFTRGNASQYEFALSLYQQALKLKAQEKNKKPEEMQKLDTWYQEELPKKIRSRGKDAHLTHDELVQCMKWKLTRGKFYSQMINLVMINTPKAVATETRKALRKLPNLESALTNLSSLKGVGTTMATAVLAAAAPEIAPFMADECLMAIPDTESIEYTVKEYLKYVQNIRTVVDRLNAEGKNSAWSPHRVELALWAHYIVRKLEPALLDDIPDEIESPVQENGDSNKSNDNVTNGSQTVLDGKDSEDSSGPMAAVTEDSSEATNDSLSVVINSEETSREAVTNGNETTSDNTDMNTVNNTENSSNSSNTNNSNGHDTSNGDKEPVVDGLSTEPSSKKIRLQADEGAP